MRKAQNLMSALLILTLLLGLTVFAPSQAAYAAGSLMSETFDSYNAAALGGQGPWVSALAGGSTIDVISSGYPSGGNGNVVKLTKGTGSCYSTAQFTQQSGYIVAKARVQPWAAGKLTFYINNGTGNPMAQAYFDGSGQLKYNNGSAAISFSPAVSYDNTGVSWYDVEIHIMKVDGSANYNRARFFLNSNECFVKQGDTGMRNATYSVANSVRIDCGANTAYVDDISVEAKDGPVASNVQISAAPTVGLPVDGTYSFTDDTDTNEQSTFKWYICDTFDGTYTEISNATSKSYVPTPGQEGKFIKFEVTPKNSLGIIGTAVSSTPVQVVSGGTPPEASNASISGVAKVEGQLEVNYTYTSQSNRPEGATTVRWLSADAPDGAYSEISTGTSKTLTLTNAQLGKYIKAEITPKDVDGFSGTVVTAISDRAVCGDVLNYNFDTQAQLDEWTQNVPAGETIALSNGSVYFSRAGGTSVNMTKSVSHPSNVTKLSFVYKIYFENMAKFTAYLYGQVDGGTTNNSATQTYFTPDAKDPTMFKMQYYGATNIDLVKDIELGKWHSIRIDVDTDANTEDIYFDGNKVLEGGNMRNAVSNINSLKFDLQGVGSLYVDDVHLYVDGLDMYDGNIKPAFNMCRVETSSTLSAVITVPNTNAWPISFKAMVALYNPQGSLSQIAIQDIMAPAKTLSQYKVSLPKNTPTNTMGYKAKAFVWDMSGNLRPITESALIERMR